MRDVGPVVGLYLQVLAVLLPPVITALVAWLAREVVLHLRSAQARAVAQQLVAWATQTIPQQGERYPRVADLLSRQFPELRPQEVEVLIESSVQALKAGLASAAAPAAAAEAATAAATAATAVASSNGSGSAGGRDAGLSGGVGAGAGVASVGSDRTELPSGSVGVVRG